MPKILHKFKPCWLFIPRRFVVYGLTSAACFICFFHRQTHYRALSNIFDQDTVDVNAINSKCPRMTSYYDRDRKISPKDYQPWKPSQIRAVNQAFFIGFIVTLIPGGVVADMYGGKSVIAAGIIAGTLVNIAIPTLIELGPSAMVFGRLFQGLSQGLVYPAVSTVTAQWAPISERTVATGIIYAGQFFGWTVGYWIRLPYSQYTFDWAVQFYVCAVLGLVWLVLWTLFSFSMPSHCPYISETELKKIKSPSKDEQRYHRIISAIPLFIPWKEILTSFPLISLVLINWAGLWVHYTMMNFFRIYLLNVIGLTDDLSNDLVEVSHTVLGVSAIVWAVLIDWLINHNYISRTKCRRYFAFLSNIVMIPLLVSVLLAGCQGQVVGCLYLTFCFCRGPFYASLRTNVIDLNPHFAGILNGIVHCSGAVVGVLIWDFYSLIVKDNSDTTHWASLFLVISAILLFFSLPYLWFGSGEFQPWGLNKLVKQYDVEISPSPSNQTPQQNTS